MRWIAETGVHDLWVFGPTKPPDGVPAGVADLLACLKANPDARTEVLTALASGISFERNDRAEQAEQRVHELTHDVQCCELLERELRESVSHSRTRAEQAERDLAALTALIHDESGFDDHHPAYSPAWAVKEMAQRWAGATAEVEQAERELAAERDAAALAEIAAQQRFESVAHDHAKAIAERDEAREALASAHREVCDLRRRVAALEAKSGA